MALRLLFLLAVATSVADRLGRHISGFAGASVSGLDATDDDLDLDLDLDAGGGDLDLDLDLDGAAHRHRRSAASGGGGDDEADPQYDDELEEYSFESPDAVHAAWKSALEELKDQSKETNDRLTEQYREMQRKVSKGEMTKEEMNERRVQLEKEAEEQSGIPISCQQGRQSCLHDEKSPLIERAVAEAKAHMTHRPSNQRSALRAALLPSLAMPDIAIGSLPRPPGYTASSSGGDGGSSGGDGDGGYGGGAASVVDDPEAFALLDPGMQSYLTSVATVQHVQNGAIVNTGALPFNVSEWEELAASSRERKDQRTCVRHRGGRIRAAAVEASRFVAAVACAAVTMCMRAPTAVLLVLLVLLRCLCVASNCNTPTHAHIRTRKVRPRRGGRGLAHRHRDAGEARARQPDGASGRRRRQ
jgi:hypothetical protein